ncbi:hypothetical protein DIPPA_08035 [Diplonema papillatum]|nr:hypothetical protein DIPPA_08035 [Diplonema papillatum]
MVDVGLGRTKIKVWLHDDFRLVLLATLRDAYHSFPPPLLNRFEKHRLFQPGAGARGLLDWVVSPRNLPRPAPPTAGGSGCKGERASRRRSWRAGWGTSANGNGSWRQPQGSRSPGH